MLRDHADALEADFQRYYGIDLTDLWRGTLTPRRTAVLAMNLPPGAGLWTALDVPPAWSVTDHLLAHAVDQLQVANWQRTGRAAKGQGFPDPIPRPGGTQKRRGALTVEEQARRFRWRQKDNEEVAE